jgi:hypothetical protein
MSATYSYSRNGRKIMSGQSMTAASPSVAAPKVDRDAQGRAAWGWLHGEALAGRLTAARLATEFRTMIPNYGCSCLREWEEDNVKYPFRPHDQFGWSVERHNLVNGRLVGKPQMTVEEASLGR